MFDILILNGCIVDGTGTDGYMADLGIKDGIIAEIGDLSGVEADKIIDAAGKTVTPGFIDAHSHADCSAPMWPDMESSLGQGITTCVAGHCGMGIAPVHNYWLEQCFEEEAFSKLIPWKTGGPVPGFGRVLETETLKPVFEELYGQPLDWRTFGEYLDRLDRGTGANLVCFVGHSQLRQQVLGAKANRPATEAERIAMGELLRKCLDEGAWGMSLGLDYYSSMDADDEELVYLMKIVAEYGRIVTTHAQSRIRRRGEVDPAFLYREGLIEVLELAKMTGVELHISHLRATYDTPGTTPEADEENRKASLETLEIIERYRAQGVKVGWDLLHGTDIPVFYYPQLCYKFRPYVEDCGGPEGFSKTLKNPWFYHALVDEIRAGNHRGKRSFLYFQPDRQDNSYVIKAKDETLLGRTLKELADECGLDTLEMALQLLMDDPYIMCEHKSLMSLPQGWTFIQDPDVCMGTDNGAYNYDYVHNDGVGLQSHGCPSAFCQMIEYVTEDFGFSFEQLVKRMTGNAARSYGITDRGFLKEGQAADILILDRKQLRSNYNLVEPRTMPDGLDYVIVNGRIAKEGTAFTHVRSGHSIRK